MMKMVFLQRSFTNWKDFIFGGCYPSKMNGWMKRMKWTANSFCLFRTSQSGKLLLFLPVPYFNFPLFFSFNLKVFRFVIVNALKNVPYTPAVILKNTVPESSKYSTNPHKSSGRDLHQL